MRDEPDDPREAGKGEEDLPEPDTDDAERNYSKGARGIGGKRGDDRCEDGALDDTDRGRRERHNEGGVTENRREDPSHDGADQPGDRSAGYPARTQGTVSKDAGADTERDRDAGRDDSPEGLAQPPRDPARG